ncbi:SRPBCC domain-containing protein (plasmid) [Phyllobacterium sp. 628]|uniref:SRPBCC family protein n=1 Tax=Phyllobacterium sp. 628 TaxID=2718938 RepID=UPI00166242CB|nr:SRPBCC domain-containing protein [Phyllobacterium sp. 628]QND54642.1 SRPBCC domain-containing protein [Phyllobacterium sp. 628]
MTETLHSEIEIAAPQATVFAFLTDPDKILRWMGTKATIEPHAGGIYLLSLNDRNTVRGQFTEVIPVHRLAYSFGWEERENVPPGSTLVEIDLVEKDGGTLVRFTHSGLPDAQERAEHEKGWSHYLRRLSIAAPGGDPGPDKMGA